MKKVASLVTYSMSREESNIDVIIVGRELACRITDWWFNNIAYSNHWVLDLDLQGIESSIAGGSHWEHQWGFSRGTEHHRRHDTLPELSTLYSKKRRKTSLTVDSKPYGFEAAYYNLCTVSNIFCTHKNSFPEVVSIAFIVQAAPRCTLGRPVKLLILGLMNISTNLTTLNLTTPTTPALFLPLPNTHEPTDMHVTLTTPSSYILRILCGRDWP